MNALQLSTPQVKPFDLSVYLPTPPRRRKGGKGEGGEGKEQKLHNQPANRVFLSPRVYQEGKETSIRAV